jgi:hypothetical protein
MQNFDLPFLAQVEASASELQPTLNFLAEKNLDFFINRTNIMPSHLSSNLNSLIKIVCSKQKFEFVNEDIIYE